MNAELKQQWIEALRSGCYKQGRDRLRNPGGFLKGETWCCLGVLCDIRDPQAWTLAAGHEGKEVYTHASIDEIVLSHKTLKEVGLDQDTMDTLTTMNDGVTKMSGRVERKSRYSFNEIADWIEENVPVD